MNRLSILLVACGVFLTAMAVSGAVQAQSALSEAHIERIRQNCVTVHATLQQLHASDGLLRVNRGPLYENISTKLMAPLNSRIALSRLSGLEELAATTLEYDRQLDIFRASYKQYEESMSRTMRIDCASRPAEFYDGIGRTRELRQTLYADSQALTELLIRYKVEFEEFSRQVEGVA